MPAKYPSCELEGCTMSNKPTEQDILRAEAERQLVGSPLAEMPTRSAEELLHELQVYQIELEMQNETLRQSQITLEESRDRYVDFYDFAPTGYVTLNCEALITEINLTGAMLLGKERSKLANRRFAQFVAPEDLDLWHRHFMDALKHDSKLTCELEIHRGDGSHLSVQIDSLRLEKNGKAPVVRIALTDITERKLAEESLRESETYLRLLEQREIVQTSLDGFWVVDKNARILEANDAFCDMVGYSREELLNMCITDLEVDEAPDETAAHIKKIMEIGYDRFEARHRHKQGHLVDLEVSVTHSELDSGINFVFVRDITERKQVENNLRESENRFRTLFESASDCMLILDMDGRIVDINRTGHERLGYEEHEMLGRRIAEFDTPEHTVMTPERIAKIMKEGKVTFEAVHVRKDGTVMPVEVSSNIIHLNGKQRFFSVIRDITERKLLEQDLRLKEFILEHARDAVYLSNNDMRFVYVNDEACRVLGYRRNELLSLTPFDIDPDVTLEETRYNRELALAKGTVVFEKRHKRRDGSTFPVEISYSLIEYQGQTMKIVLARDITERKRAERKVAELQQRNELILNTAGDGICGINKKGRINFINPAAAIMLGYNVEELYGLSLYEIVHPTRFDAGTCPTAQCPVLTSLDGSTTCHKGDEVYRRKDGSTFPVSCTRSPIVDRGKCIGVVVMFRDITERKHAEQQVRELSAHLLTAREEEKANIAREIHDDLGSTLAALKIEIHMLDKGLSVEQKKIPLFMRVEPMVTLLDNAIKATRRIITDLRPTILDDYGLLDALKWQADEFNKHTGIYCRVACIHSKNKDCEGCKDCEYTLDKTLSINLFRIFQESLTNVSRHSGASRVEVELRPDGNEVVLSISDNGRGLPERHTIASTSFGIRGMRERAGQLGGKIEIGSPPGGGFNVTAILPMPAAPQQEVNAGYID
jgi:PAS domain S-box-containing protein